MMGAPRQRRALAGLGGPVRAFGSEAEAAQLRRALELGVPSEEPLPHIHGFHSWPARLHPATAAHLIRALSRQGQVVLDPFCGSGTVPVEALVTQRLALASDLNPLAVELTWLKTRVTRDSHRERLLALAEIIADRADDRRLRRAGATRAYPEQDTSQFAPHVLLELDGLRSGLEAEPSSDERRALWLVLSAILTKVSRRRGDSAEQLAEKRLAAGYTIKLFRKKAEELARRLSDLSSLVRHSAHVDMATAAQIFIADARKLPVVESHTVDLIVTSPPYPGVYDYLAHHDTRLRWLKLSSHALARGELGARRQLTESATPKEAWEQQLAAVLAEMHRCLRPTGAAVLVIGDSVIGRELLPADELVDRAARKVGFRLVAGAAQERAHHHRPTSGAFRQRPRAEHALLLRPDQSSVKPPRNRSSRPD